MLRKVFGCACARLVGRLSLLAVVAVVAGTLLTAPSFAALIGTYSLQFDGHVKSGANTGVEGHFNANIPYITPNPPQHELPANVDPPGPLANANDLRVTETEAANHIILSITSKNGLDPIFANSLDPAFNVLWEGIFSWTNVPAGQKINITSIGFENFDLPPFGPPTAQTITGKGTVADPLKVSLQLAPSLFELTNNHIDGPVKIHLEYTTMDVIPEPSTVAIALMGIVGAAVALRRRHC